MGFVLGILYFITYYLTPVTIFGPLAAYRIELILAALTLIVSIPKLNNTFVWKTPQTLAVYGLALSTVLSGVFGMHWATGGVVSFLGFIPNVLGYFLVCLHCDSKRKLQVIVLVLLFVCIFVIVHGYLELRNDPPPGDSVEQEDNGSTYQMTMGGIYRLRGLGEINDPNDFGQLLVCTMPLVFFFWVPKKLPWNLAFVLLPVCILLYGAYLTHSRGAMLGLLAMAIIIVRRRIGTVPALLAAGVLYIAAMALQFTGGRDISATSGSDRTSLWGAAMEVLKDHPFFGVGYGNLPDYIGLTAHNSVMVCAAELGLFGLSCWCLFLLPTVRDALEIASPGKEGDGNALIVREEFVANGEEKIRPLDDAEIKRLGRLMVVSLTGFLVVGWFLSRAYVMTLFLLGGMTEVVYEIGLREGIVPPRLKPGRALNYALRLVGALLVSMYILLRTVNLTH